MRILPLNIYYQKKHYNESSIDRVYLACGATDLHKSIDGLAVLVNCFKRKETYSWFVVIVVGMTVRTNLRGVSSGVKKLHQNSENVGKSEDIFGHQFGMLGILAEGPTTQCVPLDIELHDGMNEINAFNHDLSEQTISETASENCIVKMKVRKFVRMMVYLS